MRKGRRRSMHLVRAPRWPRRELRKLEELARWSVLIWGLAPGRPCRMPALDV
jgi:hypothetical protein